jgi:hypothetical protein
MLLETADSCFYCSRPVQRAAFAVLFPRENESLRMHSGKLTIVNEHGELQMPLIDLRNPRHALFTRESFNHGWPVLLTMRLNEILPEEFIAVESPRFGRGLEIDIGAFERESDAEPMTNGAVAVATQTMTWAPPAPTRTIVGVFPDVFEVRVFLREGVGRLVAAIELVSPSNKDRPEEREAFVAKCASYLKDGVSVVIIDTVTARSGNLHAALLKLLEQAAGDDVENVPLYAASYRPVKRHQEDFCDIWAYPLKVGEALPTLPLRLTGDLFVPLELEATYADSCRRHRII